MSEPSPDMKIDRSKPIEPPETPELEERPQQQAQQQQTAPPPSASVTAKPPEIPSAPTEGERMIERELKELEVEDLIDRLERLERRLDTIERALGTPPERGGLRDLAEDVTSTARLILSNKDIWDSIMRSGGSENPFAQLMMYYVLSHLQYSMMLKQLQFNRLAQEMMRELRGDSRREPEETKKLREEIDRLRKALAKRARTRIRKYINTKIDEIKKLVAEKFKSQPDVQSQLISKLDELRNTITDMANKTMLNELKGMLERIESRLSPQSQQPQSPQDYIKMITETIRAIREATQEISPPRITSTIQPAKYKGELPIWLHPDALENLKTFVNEIVGGITERILSYMALKAGVPAAQQTAGVSEESLPKF